MRRLVKTIAVLDADVLYPAPVRDILLSLADAKLFQPKWTKTIEEEWTRNLLTNRPDITGNALAQTVKAMNSAFPDASFGIKLSNPDDFVNDLIQAYPDIARFAFETMVSRLKNPPITREDVLAMLKRCGLPKTTQILTNRNQRL